MKKIIILLFACMLIIHTSANADDSFGGIGAGIFKEPYNHKTIVYMTLPDSPASVIPVGSEIVRINNQRTRPMTYEKIISLLRGEINTQVTVSTKDKFNKKHEYTLTRKNIVVPHKKADERFDLHWQQVAPDGFENIAFEPNTIINKLSYSYMVLEGNKIQYWFDRKKIFTKGYNACLSYPKNEQNGCLMNLVNREVNKTAQDENLTVQQTMVRQQAIQNINSNLNQIDTNTQLQNINNNLRSINSKLR